MFRWRAGWSWRSGTKPWLRAYECGICSCPANYLEFQNAPDNFTLLLNGNLAFLGTGHYADCNYNNYYYDLTQSAAWSSSNSGVVRPHTGRQWQADGVGAGSENFTGAYTGLVYLGTYCAPSQHPGQDSSPGNVCNGFTITNPVASQVFSMGGATYNSATVPLTTSSTCSGTANWTLSYSYTSRQPATYTGSSSTSSSIGQTANYPTPVALGGQIYGASKCYACGRTSRTP